jgi:hypothetical protein
LGYVLIVLLRETAKGTPSKELLPEKDEGTIVLIHIVDNTQITPPLPLDSSAKHDKTAK